MATMKGPVGHLRDLGTSLDNETKFLLNYYAAPGEGEEGGKPEDLFNLVLSFSSALQVGSLELIYLFQLIMFCRKRPWMFMNQKPRRRFR